ncbi:MAG: hypothetical protein Q8Q12_11365 [bacterium]|nr:hypothetical protein [bacterium]
MKRVETRDPQQAVYQEGRHPVVGLVLIVLGLLGLSAVVATAVKLIRPWPNHWTEYLGGLFFLAFVLLLTATFLRIGLAGMVCSQIVFDRSAGQVIESWRWFFVRRSTTHQLARFNSVSWKLLRVGSGEDSSARYPVVLKGPEGHELCLFEETSMDDARRRTHELAVFLGFGEEHWDTTFLSREARDISGTRPNAFVRVLAALVVHLDEPKITLRIEGPTSNMLVYRKGFGKLTKLLGLPFLPSGLLCMLSPWLGLEFNEGKNPWWSALLIGGMLATVGAVLVFGRQGDDHRQECLVRNVLARLAAADVVQTSRPFALYLSCPPTRGGGIPGCAARRVEGVAQWRGR